MADSPGKTVITVDEILHESLYGILVRARGEAADLPRPAIERAIRAAEDFYERDLQVFFGLKRIASDPVERGLDPATYDLAEPAYNYDPRMWRQWGRIDLNFRPVITIDQFFISYPGARFTQLFHIDPTWIRLDRKYGEIKIVPTNGNALIGTQLGAYLLSVFAGGVEVPRSIFIDYTTGLDPDTMADEHEDLLDGIRKRAVLNLLGTLGIVRSSGVGSHSISQDGQSQSESFQSGKFGPYSGMVELYQAQEKEARMAWRQQEHGVPLVVC